MALKSGYIYCTRNGEIFLYHGIEESDTLLDDEDEVYIKSEADREIYRQKRKRCLSMARIASDDFHLHNFFYAMGKQNFELRAMNRCEKHRAKWIELANVFKKLSTGDDF